MQVPKPNEVFPSKPSKKGEKPKFVRKPRLMQKPFKDNPDLEALRQAKPKNKR